MVRNLRLFKRMLELIESEEPFVVITVIDAKPPTAVKAGHKAIIRSSGEVEGWLGGSCTEDIIIKSAIDSMADGRIRLLDLDTCHGGSIKIYIEPYIPAEKVIIIGYNPITAMIAKISEELGFNVLLVAEEGVQSIGVKRIKPGDLDKIRIGSRGYAVIATMGRQDHVYVEKLLRLNNIDYIGVIASKARGSDIISYLKSKGFKDQDLSKIKFPAGIDIGAETPEEIAISIISEIIAIAKRRKPGMLKIASDIVLMEKRESQITSDYTSRAISIDPVCGMYVDPASTEYKVEVSGYIIPFCSRQCLERFKANEHLYIANIEKILREA